MVTKKWWGMAIALFTCWANAGLELSQKSVAERVLQNSLKAREVRYNSELSRLSVAQVRSTYDWNLSAETGYQLSRFRNFQGTANLQDETYTSLLGLKKLFTSGTNVSLSAGRTSLQSVVLPSVVFSQSPQQTQDLMGLEVQQNLLKNSFGRSDRALIRSAEKTDEATQVASVNQLQTLVLDGIRAFWQASVFQNTFKQALTSRARYEKLVEVVRRKNSLGSTSPGELAQVQAELETQNQQVKTTSFEFLRSVDTLLTLLQHEKTDDVTFQTPENLPALPQMPQKNLEGLRELRAQKLRVEAAEDALVASRSKSYADLSLVGRYETSGLSNTASSATQEMLAGNYPRYFYGIKFSYPFGSDVLAEDVHNKTVQKDLQQNVFNRRLQELQDELRAAERKTQSAHAVATSTIRQRELREQAAQELQKAYAQGRTDIKFLIDALNLAYSTHVASLRAIGDYHIALNEWAAIRDELISTENSMPEMQRKDSEKDAEGQ